MTITNGTPMDSVAYSMDASTAWSRISPAVRTTKRSPRPTSKIISTGTRESEQEITTAAGVCPLRSSLLRGASWFGRSSLKLMNLSFPASNASHTAGGVLSTLRKGISFIIPLGVTYGLMCQSVQSFRSCHLQLFKQPCSCGLEQMPAILRGVIPILQHGEFSFQR